MEPEVSSENSHPGTGPAQICMSGIVIALLVLAGCTNAAQTGRARLF